MGQCGHHEVADDGGVPRRRRPIRRLLAVGVTAPLVVAAGALPAVGAPGSAASNASTTPRPADYWPYGGPNRCAPPADTVPPQISSVTFTPAAVDVTSAAQTVEVTAQATDTAGGGNPASGVTAVTVYFSGPRGGFGGRLTLASGTATDGTWQGDVKVPTSVRSGTFHLSDVTAHDADQNYQFYDRVGRDPNSPTDLRLQSGWDSTLQVTAAPPPKRQHPGTLRAFSFSPSTVDAREGARRVRVSATLSGPVPRRVSVGFTGRSGHYVSVGGRLRARGDGLYTGRIRVGQWLGKVTTQASVFAQYDYNLVRPPYLSYPSSRLHRAGFATKLRIRSGVDRTRPLLTGLTITPQHLDTTSAPATATITATATDQGSGVRRIFLNAEKRHRPYGFYGTQLHLNGDTWTGTILFPACGPGGNYLLQASVDDAAGNYSNYSHQRLAAVDLPSYLHVSSRRGDVNPPQISGATALASDDTVTLTFSEPVHNLSTSTLAVFSMAPAASRYQQPENVSGIVCHDGSATVDCSGSPDPVTSAVLTVPGLAAGTTYRIWANLDSVTPQLSDAAGNPMEWSYDAASVRAG